MGSKSLVSILQLGNKIDNFMSIYHYIPKPVVLYGAGRGVMWYIKLLRNYNIDISCIIDRNASSDMLKTIEGIPIVSLGIAVKDYNDAYVIISAPAYRDEIKQIIIDKTDNWQTVIFDPTLEVLQRVNHKTRVDYYKKNIGRICNIFNCLEDEFSKKTYEAVLSGAISSDCDMYREIGGGSQYFPDIVMGALHQDEVFCDVGCFVGDSIQDFVDATKNVYKKIIAFEPIPANLDIAKKTFSDSRIEFYPFGVGEKKEIRFFELKDDIDEGAVLDEKERANNESVEIVKLDDVISEPVSYIKMDIEGMELAALKGGEDTIRKYRPKLAISIYHRLQDFLELPEFIISLGLDYKLFIRHYWEDNGTDTVLFAL